FLEFFRLTTVRYPTYLLKLHLHQTIERMLLDNLLHKRFHTYYYFATTLERYYLNQEYTIKLVHLQSGLVGWHRHTTHLGFHHYRYLLFLSLLVCRVARRPVGLGHSIFVALQLDETAEWIELMRRLNNTSPM